MMEIQRDDKTDAYVLIEVVNPSIMQTKSV